MKVKKSVAYALHALVYMVRHKTQLPVTTRIIAKSEGIPPDYLAKVFQILNKSGFVKSVRGRKKGYVFDKQPEDISLLMLIEAIEGGPIFNECFLKHCECGGTRENCDIYSIWVNSTKQVTDKLKNTNIESVAWSHPDHRFDSLPDSLELSVK